jgi:hypothetical protein
VLFYYKLGLYKAMSYANAILELFVLNSIVSKFVFPELQLHALVQCNSFVQI